jgi:hypothetical protein
MTSAYGEKRLCHIAENENRPIRLPGCALSPHAVAGADHPTYLVEGIQRPTITFP